MSKNREDEKYSLVLLLSFIYSTFKLFSFFFILKNERKLQFYLHLHFTVDWGFMNKYTQFISIIFLLLSYLLTNLLIYLLTMIMLVRCLCNKYALKFLCSELLLHHLHLSPIHLFQNIFIEWWTHNFFCYGWESIIKLLY